MHWDNYTAPAGGWKEFWARDERVFDACGISGYINIDGTRDSGDQIVEMITILKDRENGLGAGFAAYGLFPDHADEYCLQLLLDDADAEARVRAYLETKGDVIAEEPIPTNPAVTVPNPPVTTRFFFDPGTRVPAKGHDDYVVDLVMHVNARIPGAFIMSSGKNMAVFKGNGWSYEIADYYRIRDYEAYLWLAHSRFPTNTPGWWGGAHPFSLLDWAVVHNGEITSYGTNKRYLEMNGYQCTLLTDTEVLAYLFDLLARRHQIPLPIATLAFNPPLHEKIALMPSAQQAVMKNVRMTYRSAMVNGPFSILVAKEKPVPTLIGLMDRKKLRPQVAALSDDGNTVFIASEEASFRRLALGSTFQRDFERVWFPKAGTPIIVRQGEGIQRWGMEEPFEGIELAIEEGA